METFVPNNILLPNLRLQTKVIYTALIAVALAFYLATWHNIMSFVYLETDLLPKQTLTGIALGILAAKDYQHFSLLFALHAASLLILLSISFVLFRKTSLRRRTKKILLAIAILLITLDLLAWYQAPSCSSSNSIVGILGLISGIPLVSLALVPLFQLWVYKRWKNPEGRRQRVVIIGGGFAGLYTALGLNRKLGYHKDLEIVVLDKKNYFLFPPLLPSAAAGTIETRQVSYPFRRIFETTNIIYRKLAVTSIEPKQQIIRGALASETNSDQISNQIELKFDYLVLAPGSITQTFGTKGVVENAFFMRQLNDAVILRNHVINCFERAALSTSEDEKKKLLSFMVIGAGPTGIETATEIYDLIHSVLLKRYPEVESSIPKVSIIQSGESILPGWDPKIIGMVVKQLKKVKINIYLNSRVAEVGKDFLSLGSAGSKLYASTIIWCAGVKPAEILRTSGLPLHTSQRIAVDDDLRVPGYKNIFVLGDAAHLISKKTNRALPPLGQVAFQQGSHTANNIVKLLNAKSTKPFSYFDFGGLVSVGEHYAAVNLMGLKVSGFIGWFIWRSLYLAKLVGFSNKVRVVLDWTLDLLIERSISQIRDYDEEYTEASTIKLAKLT